MSRFFVELLERRRMYFVWYSNSGCSPPSYAPIQQVLGEAYSTQDEEDMSVKEVTAISISQGRYQPRRARCRPRKA